MKEIEIAFGAIRTAARYFRATLVKHAKLIQISRDYGSDLAKEPDIAVILSILDPKGRPKPKPTVPPVCPVCNESFAYASWAKRHMIRHHPEAEVPNFKNPPKPEEPKPEEPKPEPEEPPKPEQTELPEPDLETSTSDDNKEEPRKLVVELACPFCATVYKTERELCGHLYRSRLSPPHLDLDHVKLARAISLGKDIILEDYPKPERPPAQSQLDRDLANATQQRKSQGEPPKPPEPPEPPKPKAPKLTIDDVVVAMCGNKIKGRRWFLTGQGKPAAVECGHFGSQKFAGKETYWVVDPKTGEILPGKLEPTRLGRSYGCPKCDFRSKYGSGIQRHYTQSHEDEALQEARSSGLQGLAPIDNVVKQLLAKLNTERARHKYLKQLKQGSKYKMPY